MREETVRALVGLPRRLRLSSRLMELGGELLVSSLAECLLQEATGFPTRATRKAFRFGLGFTRW